MNFCVALAPPRPSRVGRGASAAKQKAASVLITKRKAASVLIAKQKEASVLIAKQKEASVLIAKRKEASVLIAKRKEASVLTAPALLLLGWLVGLCCLDVLGRLVLQVRAAPCVRAGGGPRGRLRDGKLQQRMPHPLRLYDQLPQRLLVRTTPRYTAHTRAMECTAALHDQGPNGFWYARSCEALCCKRA